MINRELVDFIKAEKSKGKSEEEIKALLIANGWNEGDIKEGFDPVFVDKFLKENKDKKLLKKGKIIFYIGLLNFIILLFLLILSSNFLGIIKNTSEEFRFVSFFAYLVFAPYLFLYIFIFMCIQVFYAFLLFKRKIEKFGILNMIFPALFVLYILVLKGYSFIFTERNMKIQSEKIAQEHEAQYNKIQQRFNTIARFANLSQNTIVFYLKDSKDVVYITPIITTNDHLNFLPEDYISDDGSPSLHKNLRIYNRPDLLKKLEGKEVRLEIPPKYYFQAYYDSFYDAHAKAFIYVDGELLDFHDFPVVY